MKKQLLILLLVASTASPAFNFDYQIKLVEVLPIDSYPARIELSGITVAADPYLTDERSFTAFDVEDLNSRGYFPIHVIIRNSSTELISIRTRDIVVVTRSGQQLYTTPATIVVQDVKGEVTSLKTGSPLLDFTEKELTNRLIDPETVSDGFLFFFTPEPEKGFFEGSRLLIPQMVEEDTRRTVGPFSIPLDPAIK